jgi:TolB-like protein
MGDVDSPVRRLFKEMRRRRIFRTAALYIVATWLVMQVADVVFPALDIPERAIRYVLMAALLGFPAAIIFGWVYDVGTHGIRRTPPAGDHEVTVAQPLRRSDYAILSLFGVVATAIFFNAFSNVSETQQAAHEPRGDGPPMVAVLPFVSNALGGESESFAFGVHDDLLTQLSKIQSIRVISRTSVLEYRDTVMNIRDIGAELGADAILEGGVQSAGDRIRINAQLIDAHTDEHMWAQTYDRELTLANIFDVQSEIARAITSAMRATLTEKDATALAAIPTENMAAYRAYHRAIELRENHGRAEDVIEILEEAVALDPMFTRAWAELVGSVSLITLNRQEYETERIKQAETALEHIRSIAPESPDYVIAQAYYTYYTLKDYDRALQLILRAQEMVPSDARLFEVASWIQRRQGDFDGRIESLKRARELDPKEKRRVTSLVLALMISHYYDEAQSVIDSAGIDEYWLSVLESVLRVREHRDFGIWRQEVARLATEFDAPFYLNDLWDASIANRDYPAAEGFLSEMPDYADDPDMIHRYISKLRMLITTYYFSGKQNELAAAATQLRAAIEGRRDPDGSFRLAFDALDSALIEAVEGDTDEALSLARQWRRLASADVAEIVRGYSPYCSILGLIGASREAVECLRKAFEEPSRVAPFMDPFYPHYDSIREEPEFVKLLADFGVLTE